MVELIPKHIKKALPLQNVFFYGALAVLVLVLAAYILLIYFESRASLDLQNLEGDISRVGTVADRQLEGKVFATERKITDFSEVIAAHQKPSRIFPFLEENTHPQVWFSEFDLNMATNFLRLGGHTLNFRTLGEQLGILKPQEMIREIQLSDLSIGEEGQADFTLGLTLDPQIFK